MISNVGSTRSNFLISNHQKTQHMIKQHKDIMDNGEQDPLNIENTDDGQTTKLNVPNNGNPMGSDGSDETKAYYGAHHTVSHMRKIDIKA